MDIRFFSQEEDEMLENMELGILNTCRETLFPCGHVANDQYVHKSGGECPECEHENLRTAYEYLLDLLLRIPSVFV